MLCRRGYKLLAVVAAIAALSGAAPIAAASAFASDRPSTGAAVEVVLEHQERYAIVRDPSAQTPTYYYARRRQFTYTAEGYFVTREGLRLQGYSPGAGFGRQGDVGDIQGPPLHAIEAPRATEHIALSANLPPMGSKAGMVFDPARPEATSHAWHRLGIYDARGTQHRITFYFTHAAYQTAGPNSYENAYACNIMEEHVWLGATMLYFDTRGRLAQVNADNAASFVMHPALGTPQTVHVDFGDALNVPGNSGLRGVTSFSNLFTFAAGPIDGTPASLLTRIETVADFTLMGTTTGGDTRHLGTLLTASFAAHEHLTPVFPTIYKRAADANGDGDDLTPFLQARHPGTPTTEVSIAGNLPFGIDSAAPDPIHPEVGSTLWQSTQIVASDGSPWTLTLYFSREVHDQHARGYPIRYTYIAALAPASDVGAGAGGGNKNHPPQSIVSDGTLFFDAYGRRMNYEEAAMQLDLKSHQAWTKPVALVFDRMTVYDTPAHLRLQADGVPSSKLMALRIDSDAGSAGNDGNDGNVIGEFTNFQTLPLGPLTSQAAPAQPDPSAR